MLFSFSYLLAALSLANSVYAVPTGSGAAYFITNDPSGNHIMSMNIDSNGMLSGITATSTGGLGAHGLFPPISPDALFSQGSIKVHAALKILLVVNPGSNTLAMYKINPINPAKLTMVGNPVSSQGDFPISIAINDQGTMACVLNGGTVNGVSCYKPHSNNGLVAIPNTLRSLGLNQTTPATGLGGSASQVAFSADGQTLLALVKGLPPSPGFVAAWAIAPDCSLSAEPVKSSGGSLPYSMTVIPGTNAMITADVNIGFDIFDFGQTKNSLSAISSEFPIPGQQATCWSSYSSNSGNFYLSDLVTSIVTEVSVDKNSLKGTIVRQYQQVPNSATMDNDIATIGNNDFLYVLASNMTTVKVFNVNTAGNALKVQDFNFASAAKEVGVTPDPNYLQGMTTFIS